MEETLKAWKGRIDFALAALKNPLNVYLSLTSRVEGSEEVILLEPSHARRSDSAITLFFSFKDRWQSGSMFNLRGANFAIDPQTSLFVKLRDSNNTTPFFSARDFDWDDVVEMSLFLLLEYDQKNNDLQETVNFTLTKL